MGDITINVKQFQDRIGDLIGAWKQDSRSGNNVFNGAGSIVIILGKLEEFPDILKNSAMHFWLLGYEFTTTLMVITTEKLIFVTTPKKAKHLEKLKGGRFPVEVSVRGKDAAENERQLAKITDAIKAAGKKVGVLPNDNSKAPFVDEWRKAYGDNCKDVEEVDITAGLSAVLSVKVESELRMMRLASKACVLLMHPYFLREMSSILDKEKQVKHSQLADKIDRKLDDQKFWKEAELPNKSRPLADVNTSQLEWSLGPLIQSGGKYDLKGNAVSNDNILHPGVIIAAMGLRYKQYCSNIARTFLVDPNKSQESNYKLLLAVHKAVIGEIRNGVAARDVYNKALSIVKSRKPELEKHFLKSVGWATGLEAVDPTLMLNAKSTRTLLDGMTLCINVGLVDLANPNTQDKHGKLYSLQITDTVRVKMGECVVFTVEAPIDSDANFFFFKDDVAAVKTPKREKHDSRVGAVATKNITSTRLRSDRSTQNDELTEKRRRDHQKILAGKTQKEGLERFAEATGSGNGVEVKKFKRFESYKRDNQFPPQAGDLSIIVDTKTSTIVLPIMGRPVPFHINAIKNASKNDEGEWSFLRINFLSPGQGVGRKDDQPFEDASAHFVRSLTFRSTDGNRYADIASQISNMKRDLVKREQEEKDMEDVVEQEKLVEIRNRRPPVLDNVYLRPADGKRVVGKVEIQQNGLRYQSPLNPQHRIDILFSNVRHLIFQPCQSEPVVLIHIHLKNPIMIGNKKKTKDVQFYRDASDVQFDETGNRKRKYRYGDEDEFEAEQEERRRRNELDSLFHNFATKIAEAAKDLNVVSDMPQRDYGFNGVPHRSNVFIQPTVDCLVQLTEQPFMVITLQDVEIAHLERVQFGLKNFDLVLVFKDFARPPFHINTIPVDSLERVKDYLDTNDIPFSEGPLNLNWPTIMKTVVANTHQFFKDGGWGFLQEESDNESGDDEEDEESDFKIDESELDAASESSEEDSEDGSAFSEGEDDEEEEDEAELSDDEEREEGWDKPNKAKKHDRPDDDDRHGRKKRKH